MRRRSGRGVSTVDAPEHVAGYRELEPVGRGGFSTVYRARHERLDRLVALKVLACDGADRRALRRFQRECELAGRLADHPHVVAVLDAGTTRSGRPYLAMEYRAGGSLADRLRAGGPLPVDEVVRIGVQISGALAAAHEAGVLHRDIKPENVLLSRYGDAALADFGIAQLADGWDGATRTGALSPYHAAPEVLDGAPGSVAGDIYALGSTLYQLLAGRPAFQAGPDEGIAPVILRILHEPPPPLVRGDVPEALTALLWRAMAKRPADRFSTADQLAAALCAVRGDRQGWPVPPLVSLPGAARARVPGTPPEPDSGLVLAGTPAGWPRNGPSGSDPTATMPRPGRAAARDAEEAAPVRRRRGLAVGVAVTAVAMLAAGGAAYLTLRPAGSARARVTLSPAGSPSPVPSASLALAAPQQLAARDGGTTVTLSWRLPTGSRYPLVVQQTAATGGTSRTVPVGGGATSTVLDGLDAKRGYCFQVGAVLAFGQPTTVAWSSPVCVHGASVTTSVPGGR